MELPFTLETPLERSIAADPEWQAGVVWGVPRAGHLEGPVMYHIADVLTNIDHACPSVTERRMLRLIALLHDTFKYKVEERNPRIGKIITRTLLVSSLSVMSLIQYYWTSLNSMIWPIIAGVWATIASIGKKRRRELTILLSA